MASAKQIRNQLRLLRWAQGSKCAECGEHVPSASKLTRHHPDYPTFDHVIPRCYGGGRTLSNGLLKHQRCNQARGNTPPTKADLKMRKLVAERLKAVPPEVRSPPPPQAPVAKAAAR